MTPSRRDLGALALGAAAIAGAPALARAAAVRQVPYTVEGARLGICLYNFKAMPRPDDQAAYTDLLVDRCVETGCGLVEVNAPYIEPKTELPNAGLPLKEAELHRVASPNSLQQKWVAMSWAELQGLRNIQRRWRIDQGPAAYADFRRKMLAKGLTPFSMVVSFTADMTDAEIDATFRAARALGVKVFSTNQTKVEMATRLKPYAERYGMDLGFHNHTEVDDPNEVASAAGLEALFARSPRFKSNLDVGWFTASNQDALAFLMRHADRITHLHMKDGRRNASTGTPWGQGEAPLKPILRWVKDTRSQIPCFVEYEYKGTGTGVEETVKCLDYMRAALTAA